MKPLLFAVIGMCLIVDLALSNTLQQRRPDFGVIINDDGDFSFVSPDPILARKLLEENISGNAALGINTVTFSVGSGSDVLNYPTKAGSPTGWRKTSLETKKTSWSYRMENARNAIASGLDAVNIAGQEAKKTGMRFIPSLRMNDVHFIFSPFDYPLTGEFWLKNHETLKMGSSPVSFSAAYGNLLDYSHEAVRNYRLSVINEVIDRNKEVIDGFELDFNRMQLLFAKGKAEEGAPLVTELVRKVRYRLDQTSKEQGRPMSLFVRIPPSLATCQWAGLEVEKWMEEGLIDLVSPAQLMTLAGDMPIRDMIDKAHRYGVLVYPSLYPRTSWRAPLDFTKTNLGLDAPPARAALKEEVLAAAATYRHWGADGFYLFNFYGTEDGLRPYPDWMYALVASLKLDRPESSTKIYTITKTYYNDELEPSYAYVKQLPKIISGNQDFYLEIGELPTDTSFPIKGVILRLGIKPLASVNTPTVQLNGLNLKAWKTIDAPRSDKKTQPDFANQNIVYLIEDPALLRRGSNKITVTGDQLPVTDLEIAYLFKNQLNHHLLRVDETFPRLPEKPNESGE